VLPDEVVLARGAQWLAAALDCSPERLQRLMRRCNAPPPDPRDGAPPPR